MTDDAYLIAVSQVGQQAVFDAMVEALWASLPLEHGPVYYEFYGELINRIGFAEAQAAFNARYPLMADEAETNGFVHSPAATRYSPSGCLRGGN